MARWPDGPIQSQIAVHPVADWGGTRALGNFQQPRAAPEPGSAENRRPADVRVGKSYATKGSMKLSVLALDFDGTIARDDRLEPDVRTAIAEVRGQGVSVVLATGRILSDLQRVTGDLHFADAVVAENGAVLAFPDSGTTSVLGPAPPQVLLDALRAEGIPVDVGQVVVEAEARFAGQILQLVRRLELPLSLAFNRGRLMVLPQAVSKATGVRRALAVMRLSPHNAVGIGDAENDHELLQTCEVGVAVAWGSQRLQEAADYVLPGEGPPAVADYIRTLANRLRVPTPVQTRRQLLLGYADNGEPLSLAVRGRNVLVAGDPRSGKSWVAGLLAEQLILHGYSVCVIDPEGDYLSLEALPGVRVFGGADPLPQPRDLIRALRHADVSLVIDLSHVSHAEKRDYIRALLPALTTLRRRTGLPHRIVLDEAHYFLHDADDTLLLDLDLNGYTLVSYLASRLHPDVLAAAQATVVTRESDPSEVASLLKLCGACTKRRSMDEWRHLFEHLPVGEAVVLPHTEEAHGDVRHIRLAPRLTPHVRHLAKYIDVPVPASRAFVFSTGRGSDRPRACTLREFVEVLDQTPVAALDGHLQRGDFSRWIDDVFGDHLLAAEVRDLEAEYRVRRIPEVRGRIEQAVRARYEFVEPLPAAS